MPYVTRSQEFARSAAEVWDLIGGFQAAANWHPALQGSSREDIDGVEHRRLDLGGGASILEKSLGSDNTSYGYEIVDAGPLPVASYRGVLSVAPAGSGCVATWSSTFDANGAPDEAAAGAISGIYEAGFGALVERFST